MSPYPESPGHRFRDTSMEAAAAIAPRCGPLQRMVLAAISDAGAEGLTTDELSAVLNIDRGSSQPRTSELRLLGLIVDSKRRRRNPSGIRAIVWVAKQYAPQEGGAA